MRTLLPFVLLIAGCASTSLPIPEDWTSVPRATMIRTVTVSPEGAVAHGPAAMPRETAEGTIRVEGNRLMNGGTPLTEAFGDIDSFDFLPSRDEVIFSAKKDGGYDIGLVASDGSVLNWLPADPVDEVAVQWAPRGNKVSYIVRARAGDLVRTFHIPSSFSFVVDFGPATVHALAWDAAAERYAVAYSTIATSDRVEMVRYDGTERREVVAPAARIDAGLVAFAPDAFAMKPPDLRYGERVPVVVWVADQFAWDDARGRLMKDVRHVAVVTTRKPGEALWKAIREASWADSTRIAVIQEEGATQADTLANPSTIFISGDRVVKPGHYERSGNVLRVAPPAIQSFAAGFIADQWKRTGPPNGSR